MNIDYIIIQAGGRGSRLGYLTDNKPKALVPINNLPMIFHLFDLFPDKRFIIIGDYKIDVFKKYLDVFSKVKFIMIDASKYKGTCAGIQDAINIIPKNNSFMLIWSDLVLNKNFKLPKDIDNYIGISKTFKCRWKYEKEKFLEEPSLEFGVAGLFIFKDKSFLDNVPLSGEFVRWLQEENKLFKELPIGDTKEFGLLDEYRKLETQICRPFNKVTIKDNNFIKEGIDEQGKKLAIREKAWYKWLENKNYTKMPKIYSYEPFSMELINGKNIFEYNLNLEQKKVILKKIIDALNELHSFEKIDTDYFSIQEAYINKTFDRLSTIRDMIPFAQNKAIKVNDRICKNIYFYKDELEKAVNNMKTKEFKFIHGDCTFSNMMLKDNCEPIFIDPRGYFGYTELFGDARYDWAKLYYSIVGNYDKFNRKKFKLSLLENEVKLEIESNNWEDTSSYFFELLKDEVNEKEIKLLHAIIWLSLTTYAWEDYDSIIGAFYNGIYYLEEVL